MEATEIAEQIHEHAHAHAHAHTLAGDDRLRKFAGIYVGVVAVLLAIATLGGSRAMKDMINANIHAADTYAFAQAKHIRGNAYDIAADQLEIQLADQPGMPEAARSKTEETIRRYRMDAARYESDPKTGEGRKQLLATARNWEEERDRAREADPNFELAEAVFQIAIVLGSVSIVAASPPLLGFGGLMALLGILLTINGYFLIVPLPLM